MDGWDDQRGFPWEVAARRPAERQEALIGEPRLEVPAMPSVAVLPPAERRLYIRKADVEKYGATKVVRVARVYCWTSQQYCLTLRRAEYVYWK